MILHSDNDSCRVTFSLSRREESRKHKLSACLLVCPHQRPNRTGFYWFKFGSVRLDFWKISSGSGRFDSIFEKSVRVRFVFGFCWEHDTKREIRINWSLSCKFWTEEIIPIFFQHASETRLLQSWVTLTFLSLSFNRNSIESEV